MGTQPLSVEGSKPPTDTALIEESHHASLWIERIKDRLEQANQDRIESSNALDFGDRVRLSRVKGLAPELAYGRHRGPACFTARQASVLLLLCPTDAGFFLPLTVRHRRLADHPGQVSLPGGRVERGETHWEAVLRETEEELGIESAMIQWLGPLPSLYVFASNYQVQPFVAWASREISFRPNGAEVESIVPFPVFPMEGIPARTQRTLQKKGHEMRAEGWVHENQFIWGATALILESFFATLGVHITSPLEVTSNSVGRSLSSASLG